jgi:hypothetical protein
MRAARALASWAPRGASSPLGIKVELARIGRYEAEATPSAGTDTLFDFYDRLAAGVEAAPDRRDHAVF